MLALRFTKNRVIADDQSTADILKKGYIGEEINGERTMRAEEAMYLVDIRNASCSDKNRQLSFNELAARFGTKGKLMARYLTYKDWRDRGLIAKYTDFKHMQPLKAHAKKYPIGTLSLSNMKAKGTFFPQDLISIVDDKETGRTLYESYWLGQYGAYKASERGQLNKLDIYETLLLMQKKVLSLTNAKQAEVLKQATSRRSDFKMLYQVYEDWREKGYVIKTGFKFGTHFRVYFPGAKPGNNENWVHSKHVIHVFPKNSKLLISEWARAIRVAHSVRKTFILAIPGKTKPKKMGIDFILYHRKGGDAENPSDSAPKYAMLSLSEEEYIGGSELAGAISSAGSKHLELIMAIADRETAVTYYKIRQIELPKSECEYYEIDWMQP